MKIAPPKVRFKRFKTSRELVEELLKCGLLQKEIAAMAKASDASISRLCAGKGRGDLTYSQGKRLEQAVAQLAD